MTTPPSGQGDQPDSGSTQPLPPDQPQPPPYPQVSPYSPAPSSQRGQSQEPPPSEQAQSEQASPSEQAQSQQASSYDQSPPYQQAPPYQHAPPYQQPPPYQHAPPYQQVPQYAAGQAGIPGYPPPYYSSRPAGPRAGTAITSLVLGIGGLLTSFVAGILAIVFGIVTLVRVRKTAERGAGMAITGLVLGVMWTALTILLIALGIYGASHGSIAALQTGACFDSTAVSQAPVQVRYVASCDQPHNGEVVGSFVLSSSAWPGASAVASRAAAGCRAMYGGVLRQQGLSGGVRGLDYYPTQQSWASGARTVTCVVYDPAALHSGSMLTGG